MNRVMKKVTLATIVFLMLGAAVIYADSTSFVGRKVQSEAIVTLDGEKIGSVLILDGVSYAPVRVIAEASGLSAGYKPGEVTLMSETEIAKTPEELAKERRQLTIRADFLKDAISSAEYALDKYRTALVQVDETVVDFYVDLI